MEVSNGRLLDIESKDVNQFVIFCNNVKSELQKEAQEEYYRTIAHIAQSIYVYQTIHMPVYDFGIKFEYLRGKNLSPSDILRIASQELNKLLCGKKTILCPEPHIRLNSYLTFYPTKDKILFLPYIDNLKLWQVVMSKPEIKNFYPNSDFTDKKNIEIEELWTKVLSLNGTEQSIEFPLTLFTEDQLDLKRNDKEVLKYLAPDSELCERIAWIRMFESRFDFLMKKAKLKNQKNDAFDMACAMIDKEKEELATKSKMLYGRIHSQQFFKDIENETKEYTPQRKAQKRVYEERDNVPVSQQTMTLPDLSEFDQDPGKAIAKEIEKIQSEMQEHKNAELKEKETIEQIAEVIQKEINQESVNDRMNIIQKESCSEKDSNKNKQEEDNNTQEDVMENNQTIDINQENTSSPEKNKKKSKKVRRRRKKKFIIEEQNEENQETSENDNERPEQKSTIDNTSMEDIAEKEKQDETNGEVLDEKDKEPEANSDLETKQKISFLNRFNFKKEREHKQEVDTQKDIREEIAKIDVLNQKEEPRKSSDEDIKLDLSFQPNREKEKE